MHVSSDDAAFNRLEAAVLTELALGTAPQHAALVLNALAVVVLADNRTFGELGRSLDELAGRLRKLATKLEAHDTD